MKRLFGEIVVIILYLTGLPTSLILINDYVDDPAVDAFGSGVILAGVRILETAVAFALMFGVFLLMGKISRPRTGQ